MADNKKIDYIQTKVDSVSETVCNIDKELALQKAAFDAHMAQDEKMYDEFKRMNDILQQNTDSLKEHMHRSDLLEKIITKMDSRLAPMEIDFIRKAAVKEWIYGKLKFLGKVGGAIAGITALWMLLEPLLKHFIK